MPGRFLMFEKKKWAFFLRIFFIFVNMGPYGRQKFRTLLLLQIAAANFKLFLNFLPNSPHKPTFGIFKFWIIYFNFEIWNFNEFYSFLLTWNPMCWKFQDSTPTNRSQKVWNLSWIFLPMVHTKLHLGFVKFWVSDFYFIFENFKFTFVDYGEINKGSRDLAILLGHLLVKRMPVMYKLSSTKIPEYLSQK